MYSTNVNGKGAGSGGAGSGNFYENSPTTYLGNGAPGGIVITYYK